jgi:hypothetical protein
MLLLGAAIIAFGLNRIFVFISDANHGRHGAYTLIGGLEMRAPEPRPTGNRLRDSLYEGNRDYTSRSGAESLGAHRCQFAPAPPQGRVDHV